MTLDSSRFISDRHAGASVLVTGSASGIGLGIVDRFLAEGANVCGFDLLETPREGVLSIMGDATDEAAFQDAVDRAVAAHSGIDVMVCNAGVIAVEPVVDMDFAEWRRVMDININSVFLGSRAAARAMIVQGRGGVIINASSGAGRRGVPNLSHYCASKAAVLGLTKSLAMEVAARNIRVNAICPGPTNTPIMANISDEWKQAMVAAIPLGRIGEPVEIANTALFLASDESSSFTGQTLMANLGTYLA